MKVLFLSYNYPPSMSPRSVQISHLARYLNPILDLEIVTAETEDKSLEALKGQVKLSYVKKSKITNFIETSRGFRLKQALLPDLFYSWHFDLYKAVRKKILTKKIDTIVTFGQPMSTHIAGLKLKQEFKRLKWIAHFSDPWVDNIYNQYNFFTRWVNKYYEKLVFAHADKIIFTSQETIDLVMRGYPSSLRTKIYNLPHAYDPNLFSAKLTSNAQFTIRYLGNFYGQRQPNLLFAALKYLPADLIKQLNIEIIGRTDTELSSKLVEHGLERYVKIFQPVDYLKSLQLMQESDLLLIIDAPTELSPFLPSKIVDYVGANKPIFGITPKGAAQKLIEDIGYMTANPIQPERIAKTLEEMIANIKLGKIKNIPANIREKYSILNIVSQMKNIIET